MRTAGDLGKAVLRDVSRSFYLSLRILPAGFREPASIGYLLARLSDTIADAGGVGREERLSLLRAFGRVVADGLGSPDRDQFCELLSGLAASDGWSAGEGALLARSAGVFGWWDRQPDEERVLIGEVITTILSGQAWDLERFEGAGVTRLQHEAELDDYTYRVAGCVGEFWTRLGYLVDRGFSAESPAVMERLGRSYGQGLQLVNVLRDVAEDWERGRCYIPGSTVATGDQVVADCDHWRRRAEEHLVDGLRYCDRVQGRRLALASGLPALLGLLTLKKLEGADWADLRGTIKVSRREVRTAFRRALAASLGDDPGRWERAWRRFPEAGSEVAEA